MSLKNVIFCSAQKHKSNILYAFIAYVCLCNFKSVKCENLFSHIMQPKKAVYLALKGGEGKKEKRIFHLMQFDPSVSIDLEVMPLCSPPCVTLTS